MSSPIPDRSLGATVIQARYVPPSIIARDREARAGFREAVFGCMPVPPERNLSGPAMEAGP